MTEDWVKSPPAPNRRPAHVFRTLVPDQVISIREAKWLHGWSIMDLQRKFKLSYNAMRAIVHGRTYKDVGGPTGPAKEKQ